MKPGDTLRIEALKPDGHCYRYWTGTLQHQSTEGWVVDTDPGTEICAEGKVAWVQQSFIRMYFSSAHPVNLLEVSDASGKPLEVYANIASPTESVDGMLRYTDYELDVEHVFADSEVPRLIDVDEFEEAILTYHYSAELVASCNQASRNVMALVTDWVFNDDPERSLPRLNRMMAGRDVSS